MEEIEGSLSSEQFDRFNEDGYLLIQNFLTHSECDTLRDACHRIIKDADFNDVPNVIFDTVKNQQAREEYFMRSADKVRFFFEEDVFTEDGELNCPKEKSLNKIGHALHDLVPEFKQVTYSNKMKGIFKSLQLKKPAIIQSMYIFKQPKIGGKVVPHKDSSFMYTEPTKLHGVWIALEDAEVDNGCMWFVPGSHREGTSYRFLRNDTESGIVTAFEGQQPQNKPEEYVVAPVKKGGLVIIHGDVVHKSEQNHSNRSRHVYTFNVYDAALATYSPQNWAQPAESFSLLY